MIISQESGVKKNSKIANSESQHEQCTGPKIARGMGSFYWNVGQEEVSPCCAAARPEGEKSPVGGVQCRHERPDAVDLGDVPGDDGENVGYDGCCGT
jgi:hypothetical protein